MVSFDVLLVVALCMCLAMFQCNNLCAVFCVVAVVLFLVFCSLNADSSRFFGSVSSKAVTHVKERREEEEDNKEDNKEENKQDNKQDNKIIPQFTKKEFNELMKIVS